MENSSKSLANSVANPAKADLLFRTTMQQVPVGLAHMNITGDWVYVNDRTCEILGYSQEELAHISLRELISPSDVEEVSKNFELLACGKLAHFSSCFLCLQKDGSAKWIQITVSEILGLSDKRILVAVFTDIQERKEMELKLEEQSLRHINASKMNALGRMAASLAHEVNNPLTVIYGQALRLSTLIDQPSLNKQKFKKISSNIEEMSMRITQIVRGLRLFSRDGSQDQLEVANVESIMDQTLEFSRGHLARQSIRLQIDCKDKDVLVNCRPVQISQVILNLLTNAMDAVADVDDKWIHISVFKDLDEVVVEVSDSGRGIAPKLAHNLFAPFFTTKALGSGTGLGLSICRQIIDSHGGSIFHDSSKKHTTFTIRLPKV